MDLGYWSVFKQFVAITLLHQLFMIILSIAIIALVAYVTILFIKALRKYTRSSSNEKEKIEDAKTLGEKLKQHRVAHKMTQEFVAESLGVSRQAVSKWESGVSSPSTANLLALAELYGVKAEELLK